jgi:hypothetical protein
MSKLNIPQWARNESDKRARKIHESYTRMGDKKQQTVRAISQRGKRIGEI